MHAQLSLALSLRDEATFANFLAAAGSPRAQAVEVLQGQLYAGETLCYLWGAQGCGISHALQATCHHFSETGRSAQYLPLADLLDFDPESLLIGLEWQALVCLKDIHLVQGQMAWERAIFNLFNRMRDAGNLLVVAADRAPRELTLALPDLHSRLSSGIVYHFSPYTDREKGDILRFRASRLGLDMSDEVALFILNRSGRGLEGLMASLQQLDKASLRAQRKITIPFVKDVFDW